MTPSPLPPRPQTEAVILEEVLIWGATCSSASRIPPRLASSVPRTKTDLLLLTLRRRASIIAPSLGLPWDSINHAGLDLLRADTLLSSPLHS